MIRQSRLRRIGWIAALTICTGLYLVLHLNVNAVRSDVIHAERQIVQLEEHKLLLETEFETRANQLQLARWNRVEFGYSAPGAEQFIENERQLSRFSGPRAAGAPKPIRVAGFGAGGEAPPFPKLAFPELVSPLTGNTVDGKVLEIGRDHELAAGSDGGKLRIPLAAVTAWTGQ